MKETLNWYVLRTKPRQERKAYDALIAAGFELYMPQRETIKIWSDRKKKVLEPIIPSYIFIRISEKNRQSIFPAVAVTNYLFWLHKPVIIRDNEMERMKRWFTDHKQEDINTHKLSKGSMVKVESGLMSGKEGVIEKVSGKYISLTITALGMLMHVDRKSTVVSLVEQ